MSRLREQSRLIFGNLDRLEVAVVVGRSASGVVTASDVVAKTGIERPRVRAQLERFVEAGLAERLPRSTGDQYYQRVESPFWTLVVAYSDQLEDSEATT